VPPAAGSPAGGASLVTRADGTARTGLDARAACRTRGR
jgi:hypothetical protein